MTRNLKTAIIGAGGQAKIIVDIFEKINQNLVGYISSEPAGTTINGYPVLCSIEEFLVKNSSLGIEAVIISIGDNIVRKKIVEFLASLNIVYVNAIHPDSIISPKATLGNGILINAGAIIQTYSVVGDHCNIGTGASIDHDCKIESFVNIAPNATLCGNVQVEECGVVGPNATVIEKTRIGKYSIVGAGAVVLNDVSDKQVFVGVPAKYLKNREMNKSYLK